MPSKLKVGVPAELWRTPPQTGHGRVWHAALGELAPLARLTKIELDARRRASLPRRFWFKPDVWLTTGHAHPPQVHQPLVVQVHEAGWVKPDVVQAPPAFLEAIVAATDAGIAAADYVITPSESARSEVIAGYAVPAERVVVVPYGVDGAVYRPGLTGGRAMVAAAREHPEQPYVLFASVPYERKNLPALRAAMASLARRGFPHLLVIAGGALDGPGADEAMRRIEADLPGAPGRVLWLKDVTDLQLATLMAEADAFCLPSFSEGFGLTVLEAMACGAPVVVSNGGALPEVVGDAGIIAPPTAEAIERALASVLEDRRLAGELARAARARAEQLSWARTAEGWMAVLRRAANDR